MARAHPVAVTAGDLVDDLPAGLSDVPADARLVVFHSAGLSYVGPDRRHAFADVLAEASRQRDVFWVSNETAGVVREMPASAPAACGDRFLLGRTLFSRGRRQDELLALAHPHGGELNWL